MEQSMRIIHCTQKVLKQLSKPIMTLEQAEKSKDVNGIGNWYANYIIIERRKCLVMTNEKTLYTFMIPGVKKADFESLQERFINQFVLNLNHEKFKPDIIEKVIEEYNEIEFAKTNNRSVLGSMNDFAFAYQVHIDNDGGLENFNLLQTNSKINQTPMSAIDYSYPIEKLKEIF